MKQKRALDITIIKNNFFKLFISLSSSSKNCKILNIKLSQRKKIPVSVLTKWVSHLSTTKSTMKMGSPSGVSEYVLEVTGSTEVSPQRKGVILFCHILLYIII